MVGMKDLTTTTSHTDALKDGKLINVSDVVSGLKCGCVCAGCGGQLVAKKGNIKIHHFAHLNADCQTGQESALHLLAKDLFCKLKYFRLPVYRAESVVISKAMPVINIADFEVKKEVFFNSFKPDVVLYKNGIPVLFVEMAVTHFVDQEKKDKIAQLGISCIEIDLSKQDINSLMKHDRILSISAYWIYNKKAELSCVEEFEAKKQEEEKRLEQKRIQLIKDREKEVREQENRTAFLKKYEIHAILDSKKKKDGKTFTYWRIHDAPCAVRKDRIGEYANFYSDCKGCSFKRSTLGYSAEKDLIVFSCLKPYYDSKEQKPKLNEIPAQPNQP